MIFRVYNQGELAPLAHGWRCVIALPPGRKWITLIDWTTLETGRIEIAAWPRLKPQPVSINHRKVRAVIRRRLKYIAPTHAVKEALALLKGEAA